MNTDSVGSSSSSKGSSSVFPPIAPVHSHITKLPSRLWEAVVSGIPSFPSFSWSGRAALPPTAPPVLPSASSSSNVSNALTEDVIHEVLEKRRILQRSPSGNNWVVHSSIISPPVNKEEVKPIVDEHNLLQNRVSSSSNTSGTISEEAIDQVLEKRGLFKRSESGSKLVPGPVLTAFLAKQEETSRIEGSSNRPSRAGSEADIQRESPSKEIRQKIAQQEEDITVLKSAIASLKDEATRVENVVENMQIFHNHTNKDHSVNFSGDPKAFREKYFPENVKGKNPVKKGEYI